MIKPPTVQLVFVERTTEGGTEARVQANKAAAR